LTICNTPVSERVVSRYDFQHADWPAIKAFLAGIDFFDLLRSDLSPAMVFDEFYRIICRCIDLYVPINYSVISSRLHGFKYPSKIRRLISKKAAAWRTYRSSRSPDSLASYKKIATQCKSSIYQFELRREEQLVSNGNIGAFYRFANKKTIFKISSWANIQE
jgi:hypothetical protein